MTGRQRILAALNHREPDCVPIDLGAYRSSGISAIAYPRLRAALGLEPRPVYVYDPVQQLAIVDDDVLEWAGADAVEMGRGFCQRRKMVGRLDTAGRFSLQDACLGNSGTRRS